TRFDCDWSSDVCSSDLKFAFARFTPVTPPMVNTRMKPTADAMGGRLHPGVHHGGRYRREPGERELRRHRAGHLLCGCALSLCDEIGSASCSELVLCKKD